MLEYKVLGLMSGTSLDGLDIAYCHFRLEQGQWSFDLKESTCVPYTTAWKEKLAGAEHLPGLELLELDLKLGSYFATCINKFKKEHILDFDFIASHGHTIFHQPQKQLTLQIGSGSRIAAETGHTTICDFRSLDVALKGQGAPLVPIGDRLLFASYSHCLNLGGIANISFEQAGKRLAYDICPANMVFNYYAAKLGMDYDEGGKTAGSGTVNTALVQELNELNYYQLALPKSLGKEWVYAEVMPLLERAGLPVQDTLASFTEHCAIQIAKAIPAGAKLLVTGGGAYNTFLLDNIRQKSKADIHLPGDKIIEFKEALVFAFLGVLRVRNEANCLASVTGAQKDNCGGSIYAGLK